MTHQRSHKQLSGTLTRTGSAGALAAIAALALALPAGAQRPPEPQSDAGPAASVVVAAPATSPDGGLQLLQVGAGLLGGLGIGAAAATARHNRRRAPLPSTA